MGTPLGDFVRAKRDSIQPESLGLPDRHRARAPGLRRIDLASRTGISVEYLTRIEQGRDRNPSIAVIDSLADGLSLGSAEREHLRYLAKITGGACARHQEPEPVRREVRAAVLETLKLLEPAVAIVTNRLGDVLAYTSGFELLVRGWGLLDEDEPNLTRYLFTDARARQLFLDWDQVADEQAFNLWLGPSAQASEWFKTQLAPVAGPEFTRRLTQHIPPPSVRLRIAHPTVGELRWQRETLALASSEAQQIVIFLPEDETTSQAMDRLRNYENRPLRAVN